MHAVAGALFRCRKLPAARSSPGGPCTWPLDLVRSTRGIRLLHITASNLAADSTGPIEKLSTAELAKLLEGFEEGTSTGKSNVHSAGLIESSKPDSSPRKLPRKSKIEDYSAWHQWDGQSDKAPTIDGSTGDKEVDRYISDVLSDVARAKAARGKVAEDNTALQSDDVAPAANTNPSETLQTDAQSEKRATGMNEDSATSAATLEIPKIHSGEALTRRTSPFTSQPVQSSTSQKADMAALAKKLQLRLDQEIKRLKVTKELVRASLTTRAKELGRDAQVQLGMLGGKVNEVTGYNEIERLKQEVREREHDIARLREEAARAKDAYDQAVTSRSVSQRELNTLLERKHSWTDADISHFTELVRSDHKTNHAVGTSKEALKKAESEVDKAFTALLKSILERYHEEQVWSDKIRSVSTYGSLIVLLINLIVFLGAIAIVEPWKRKRLVRGLEERVKGMVEDVEHTVTGEFEEVKKNMASVAATLLELQTAISNDAKAPVNRGENTSVATSTTDQQITLYHQMSVLTNQNVLPGQTASTPAVSEAYASAFLPPSTLQRLRRVSLKAASYLAQQDPHKVDMAIMGTIGVVTGATVTLLLGVLR
ncbi:hypothetical protein QFC19_001836 [Naganishia cerealis]|uniref:Uncharacterized protein n=1 Tax=Naganishia cerealis TaxID=610337 RepID=A0ACC2WFL6_9TREE|nr:hypothetical protein QFC19_001836 [Naganishia cerealis]